MTEGRVGKSGNSVTYSQYKKLCPPEKTVKETLLPVSFIREKPTNRKDSVMNKEKFPPNLSLEEREKRLLAMSDDEIDYSDIPPLDDEFFKNAKLVNKKSKEKIKNET